jgi:hypothetical protein
MRTIFFLLRRGLASELIKHKSSFMLWFILSAPFIVVAITFLTALGDNNLRVVDPARWFIAFNFRPWMHISTFLQILFVAHINYVEHRNNTWKNLRVLPVPYWSLFTSKVIFAYVVLFLSTLIFYALVMLGGELMATLRPELGFQPTGYWREAIYPTLKFAIASMGIIAIMYWVSGRIKSILVTVVIGLMGYATGFASFLITSRQGYHGPPYARFHPFNFPGFAFDSFGTGDHALNMEFVYYGFFGGIAVIVLNYVLTRSKNVV